MEWEEMANGCLVNQAFLEEGHLVEEAGSSGLVWPCLPSDAQPLG